MAPKRPVEALLTDALKRGGRAFLEKQVRRNSPRTNRQFLDKLGEMFYICSNMLKDTGQVSSSVEAVPAAEHRNQSVGRAYVAGLAKASREKSVGNPLNDGVRSSASVSARPLQVGCK